MPVTLPLPPSDKLGGMLYLRLKGMSQGRMPTSMHGPPDRRIKDQSVHAEREGWFVIRRTTTLTLLTQMSLDATLPPVRILRMQVTGKRLCLLLCVPIVPDAR